MFTLTFQLFFCLFVCLWRKCLIPGCISNTQESSISIYVLCFRFWATNVPLHGWHGPSHAPSHANEDARPGPLPFPGSSAHGCPCCPPRRHIGMVLWKQGCELWQKSLLTTLYLFYRTFVIHLVLFLFGISSFYWFFFPQSSYSPGTNQKSKLQLHQMDTEYFFFKPFFYLECWIWPWTNTSLIWFLLPWSHCVCSTLWKLVWLHAWMREVCGFT